MTTLAYNPAGLVERKMVSRNSVVDETVDTTYGPYGPLTVKKYPGTPTLPELDYGYRYGPDGLVREEARTLWIGGTSYTSTVARELDDAGNLESLLVTGLGGFSKTVTYSAPGFGASIPGTSGYSTTAYTGTNTALATVSATRKGREALAYGNGQVTTYSYNLWLGLSEMDQPGMSYDQDYTRDYTGKTTSWTKGTANALALTYDGLGRLSSGEGVSYGYDAAGMCQGRWDNLRF